MTASCLVLISAEVSSRCRGLRVRSSTVVNGDGDGDGDGPWQVAGGIGRLFNPPRPLALSLLAAG